MHEELQKFVNELHPSTKLISVGKAVVMSKEVDAVEVENLYGQFIVWGMFSVNRGKLKGALANDANTEGVDYTPEKLIDYTRPYGDQISPSTKEETPSDILILEDNEILLEYDEHEQTAEHAYSVERDEYSYVSRVLYDFISNRYFLVFLTLVLILIDIFK